MRKQVEESTAAESARRATRPAAERDRKGRFSARRKRATVLRLLRGENLESVSRELGITAARASQWRDQFLAAGQAGLKSRAPDARDEEHQRLHAKVACSCALREGGPPGGRRPFGAAEVDAMSGAQSISARRAYGVQRVCRVWGRARSSVYVRRHATRSRASRRRGPVGAATDEVLVGHIRRVLEASPFHGEGYRKAWAKLRVVRRLMREHGLQTRPEGT